MGDFGSGEIGVGSVPLLSGSSNVSAVANDVAVFTRRAEAGMACDFSNAFITDTFVDGLNEAKEARATAEAISSCPMSPPEAGFVFFRVASCSISETSASLTRFTVLVSTSNTLSF